MTIFASTFYAATVCKIHFCIRKSQNSFSCSPSFGPFLSVKYLNLGKKLPIRTAHHTFLESRHTEANKNPFYVLSPMGDKKSYQLMD